MESRYAMATGSLLKPQVVHDHAQCYSDITPFIRCTSFH
jgi:hypothetical protein